MSFDFNRTAMRLTSTRRQSVNKDKNHKKQIAGRSTPSRIRCSCTGRIRSLTKVMKIKGQDLETNNDGKKKSDGSKRSIIAVKTQNASSSFPKTKSSVDVIRFIP